MAGRWALGTKIQRQNPVSLAFQEIVGLTDISGPQESLDIIDITNHSSLNGAEEKIPTVHRHGDISAQMQYDPAEPVHKSLLVDKQVKRLGTWHLVMPDPASTTLEFQGYVTDLSYSFPVGGVMGQAFKITLTGPIIQL